MFKKSKSEKYNNKKSRQRKLKAFEISAFVMMLLSLFAGMAFLASGCFSSLGKFILFPFLLGIRSCIFYICRLFSCYFHQFDQ
mgnify:CR=1 FL=1|jgi:hypothetical protein